MSPDFKPLFDDIGLDLEWPLHHPEPTRDGGQIFRDVPYATPWGFRPLMLDLRLPKGQGPFPTIVFIHGGAWAIGHQTITNPVYRTMDFFNRFAAAGFAVARVGYRFSAEAKFPTQLHDCKAAIRFLRHHAKQLNIDAARFAAMGDSAGGHLAALVGLTGDNPKMEGTVGHKQGSSAVSCVVNWFGPTNFLTMGVQKRKMHHNGDPDSDTSPESVLIGGAVQDNIELARAASPTHYVHAKAPPMLLQYGDADRLVPYAQGEELYRAMIDAGCEATLQRIKGADHCFWGVENSYIVDDDIAFFKKHLA